MARLALVVLAFGLIICVYAESDEVQEYRYRDNSRYNSRNKGRYDYNRDSGKSHKKWEDRTSRHDNNNRGRDSYDKDKNRNNDLDYHHSGKGNYHGKYDTDCHGNEHKNSDWSSRYDSDRNRGDFSNKGRNGGWNNDNDFHGRNRDDNKRKNWENQDSYGSGENRDHGHDYHDKNNRFDNNRPRYKGGHYDNNDDKHNNRGHNQKDSGHRRKFDTPSRGADAYDKERSSSQEHYYDTTRDSTNKPNTDSESTSNVRHTKNDHYDNRNSQSNRGRGNSYEADRRFEDNGKAREDAIYNYERSSSKEHNYDTTRDSRNKPNTDSESTSNVGPTETDHYNNKNSQSNRGKGNNYEGDRRFEDNGKAREGAISGHIPSHIAGPYENNHRDRSGEYNEDETRENTNNNERKNNNDGSKTDILSNSNDEISKNNQHTPTKTNKESDDRSIIDSVNNRDDGLIKNVPDNNQDKKVSANDQIDRQQDNTQRQEDSSQSQNSGTNDYNDHGDQKSIKVK